MFTLSPVPGHLMIAACVLYLVLGMASLGVAIGSRPSSKLRLQVNAWWLIFPVVSLSLLAYPLGPALLALAICAVAARELASHARRAHAHTGMLLAVFAMTAIGLSFIVRLTAMPVEWLFYLFVLTALNDIGQFIAGTAFGRQKVVPTISPNKTWQGLAGGVIVSVLVSMSLGGYLKLAPLPWLAGAGTALALAGFAGDISYSAVKRRLGIKDFSALIPGHGGMLDRADSLVFTAPLLYYALVFTF